MSLRHGTQWGMESDRGEDWRHRAACLGVDDPERFFPSGINTVGDRATVEAKAFCRAFCLVKDQCLSWALERGIDEGVWGGTTPRERRELVKERARRRVLDEQFPPINELERELELPVPAMRWCDSCGKQFPVSMPRHRLCMTCGTKHRDRTVRRRYTEVTV